MSEPVDDWGEAEALDELATAFEEVARCLRRWSAKRGREAFLEAQRVLKKARDGGMQV